MESKEKVNYNYSSPESQRLLKEFTRLLAELTEYNHNLESRVIFLESEIQRRSRVRFMAKEILSKIKSFITRKIKGILKIGR